MAEAAAPAHNTAYLLATQFYMPSEEGDRWAVAFSTNGSTLLVAAISVAVTVSFTCLWHLISFCAVYFYTGKRQSRYLALVMVWNSNGAWFAFKDLFGYTCQSFKDGSPRTDCWYGLLLCLTALVAFVGSIVMGVLAPSLVQIGNVAPVRPSMVFYPKPAKDEREHLEAFGIRALSVMRAFGSVDSDRIPSRSHVKIETEREDLILKLLYGYNLTGVDLGLRGGSELTLEVEGSCRTEYSWKVEAPEEYSPDDVDWYNLWNLKDNNQSVRLNGDETFRAPYATFRLHPNGPDQLAANSNVSYAVVIHSAHRPSISSGSDPWYETELRGDNTTDIPFNSSFWMKRSRPVLSCWEQDRWSYGAQSVDSVFDLKTIPTIKIPEVLFKVLETVFGAGPMIAWISNASGNSVLKSRTTSPSGVIDADKSSMLDDMERLILASFVATRSIFTDATLFASRGGYPNVFEGSDGNLMQGSGDFVISSPDIQTFDLAGVVAVAAVLFALFLTNSLVNLIIYFKAGRRGRSERWTRFVVLEAAQLFRCVFESRGVKLWGCGEPAPQTEVDSVFECEMCEGRSCLGHIRVGSNRPYSEADTLKDTSALIHTTGSEDDRTGVSGPQGTGSYGNASRHRIIYDGMRP